MQKRVKLLIIQPILTPYRKPVFEELAGKFECLVVSSPAHKKSGFGEAGGSRFRHLLIRELTFFGGRVNYQCGLIGAVRSFSPSALFISSSFHSLSFWAVILYARFKSIDIHIHSQGPFRSGRCGFFYCQMLRLSVFISTSVIFYCDYSKKSYEILTGDRRDKIKVVQNSVLNNFPVKPEDRTEFPKSVLFIGRLRRKSNLCMLIEAIKLLNSKEGHSYDLHVIGNGEDGARIREEYGVLDFITWYGEIYDQATISQISKRCSVACHPGDAGLSVVHFLSLSLPVVVHRDIGRHMGPEPSYIVNEENGMLCERENINSLASAIQRLLSDDKLLRRLSEKAFSTYLNLIDPGMASSIGHIIDSFLAKKERR